MLRLANVLFLAALGSGLYYPVDSFAISERLQKSTKNVNIARYRLPLEIVEYKKTLIREPTGLVKNGFRPAPTVKLRLRARIDIVNHFYVKGWHFETVPVKWAKSSKEYRVKLRCYRLYGVDNTLEELVGTLDVSGNLRGTGNVLEFIGSREKTFKNKKGIPIATIGIKSDRGIRPVRVGKAPGQSIKRR